MDARRLSMIAAAGALSLAGCSTLSDALPGGDYRAELAAKAKRDKLVAKAAPEPVVVRTTMAPIPNPPEAEPVPAAPNAPAPGATELVTLAAVTLSEEAPPKPQSAPKPRRAKSAKRAQQGATGRDAIAQANAQARAASRADAFVGGVQVFGYEPGRIYEVWAAPYRVTTLTLAPGETVTSKAAGDTVRWQIGETTSGSGTAQRAHVILKPLEAGLETNLILTTSQRVYMLMLKSAGTDAFNAAVAWDYPAPLAAVTASSAPPLAASPDPLPEARLNGRYKVEPKGRRPRWTPASVFDDGVRTYIAFAPDLRVTEAPVLHVLARDGEAQVVNYRQQGDLFVVDRLFDAAELRLGAKRPEVVRIVRTPDRRASR